MPEPRSYQTEAIVIKKTRLGEADSILTFYTPHRGKIQGFARSLRKPGSKLAGHLELLTHSLISLARGRNLDTITGAQTITSFLPLKTNIELASCGLYVIELVNQFAAERLENYPLFRLLLETLERLSQADSRELALRYFEMRLLENAGYRPQVHRCVSCQGMLEPVANAFAAAAGGILCPTCTPKHTVTAFLSVNAQKVLKFLQTDDYVSASRLKIEPALSGELEGVMRSYITYLLEREVKSTAWLDTLKRC